MQEPSPLEQRKGPFSLPPLVAFLSRLIVHGQAVLLGHSEDGYSSEDSLAVGLPVKGGNTLADLGRPANLLG